MNRVRTAETAGSLTIEVAGVPYALQFGDWTDDRVWSTCQFSATQVATLQTLVGAPGDPKPGATATTLSKRESNLPRGGGTGFPDGWELLAFSIQHIIGTNVTAANIALAEYLDLFAKTKFTFLVQGKAKHEGPLYKMPAGSGPHDPATAITNNGPPSPRDQAAFVLPIELVSNVSFRGEFEFETALALSSAYDIETHLQGLLKRPVV